MAKNSLSAVAGILDSEGHFRAVVTQRWRMHNHVKKGERLFVVPGYQVKEPVPWDHIPQLIRKVELYIEWWIATRNDPLLVRDTLFQNYVNNQNASHNLHPEWFHYDGFKDFHAAVNRFLAPDNACGECFACCRLPFVRIDAIRGMGTCHNYCGSGCRIYANRPKPCRDFKCLWLRDKLPPELRPDRCGVVFTPDTSLKSDPLLFEVHPDRDRPEMVNDPRIREFIDAKQGAGYKAKLITHYLPDGSL